MDQTGVIHNTITSRVVDCSKDFQTLAPITVAESSGEALGCFKISEKGSLSGSVTTPNFVDTLSHAAGFVANTTVDASNTCVCGKVESVQLLYRSMDYSDTFTVYCSIFDDGKGTMLADACAVDLADNVVVVVEGIDFKNCGSPPSKPYLSTFLAVLSL
ncbi:MAG: hypothetical protein Q9162_005977 [Coniocarpon cinnabarinum]